MKLCCINKKELVIKWAWVENTVLIFLCVCDYCKTHVNPETCVCAHVYNEHVSFPVFVHAYIYVYFFTYKQVWNSTFSTFRNGNEKRYVLILSVTVFFVCLFFIFIYFICWAEKSVSIISLYSQQRKLLLSQGKSRVPFKTGCSVSTSKWNLFLSFG